MFETLMTTAIIALATGVFRMYKRHEKAHALLKDANLYQIKATLLMIYRTAQHAGNKISAHELDVFDDLYQVYHKLGGNGFMEIIKTKITAFEIIADD